MFQVGQEVLVPAASIGSAGDGPALLERLVLDTSGRSIFVDGIDNTVKRVPSKFVHREFGLALIRVGDFRSESTLLDPLVDSLGAYFNLLLPLERHWIWKIRTLDELEEQWETNHSLLTHVVLIGHGSSKAFDFVGGAMTGDELGAALTALAPATPPKDFISIACETGRSPFAKHFSQTPICQSILGAFQEIHGAVALQFVETYFSSLLLIGSSSRVALRRAQEGLPSGTHFAEWRDGRKTAYYGSAARRAKADVEGQVAEDDVPG
jgi:hypothetical protein